MKITPSLALAAFCLSTAFLLQPASAQVVIGNTGGTAGSISYENQDTSDTATSFSFNNNGDFIALAITVGSGTNDLRGVTGADATVTFGSQSFTLVTEQQRSNDEWSGVYYLANAAAGVNTVTFDFNDDIFAPTGTLQPTDPVGAIQIGVLSLTGIDTEDPIAGLEQNDVLDDMTIPSQTPNEIQVGDLLFTSTVSRTDNADHFETASGNQLDLISNPSPNDTPNGDGSQSSFQSIYQILGEDDLTGDSVILTEIGEGGIAANIGVVFNQVPEPTSAAFLVAGTALLAFRRRRSV